VTLNSFFDLTIGENTISAMVWKKVVI